MSPEEWLTSTDPAAMLEYIGRGCDPTGLTAPRQRVSERKLRLFACACLRMFSLLDYREEAARKGEDFADGGPADGAWGSSISGILVAERTIVGMDKPDCANLLREIIGNPLRPYVVAETKYAKTLKGYQILNLNWLTPTVKRLATAAYQERLGRWECVKCGPVPFAEVYDAEGGGHGHNDRDGDCWKEARHVEDGRLDNSRLAVLADALEDAGCPEMVECPECENGFIEGQIWVGATDSTSGQPVQDFTKCEHCGGTSHVPNPILTHLRSEGPHVRGCHVLDLLIGKG